MHFFWEYAFIFKESDKTSIALEVHGNHLRAFSNLYPRDPFIAVCFLIPPI
jgi:hypothetical protein